MFNRHKRVIMFTSRPRGRPKSIKDQYDKGTPELQARRKARLPQDASDHLAGSPLGIYYAHHMIDENMYRAGTLFCQLRYAYEGLIEGVRPSRSTPTAHWGQTSRSKHIDSPDETERESRIRSQYQEVERLLKGQGQAVYSAILRATTSDDLNDRTLPLLRHGLIVLHLYFRQRGLLT